MELAVQPMTRIFEAAPTRSLDPTRTPSHRLLALLDQIDAMPDDTTGALMVGSPSGPVGTVLVEKGRICWAATPRLGRRLTDLLIERSAHPLERALFEATFRRCRREGRPLGETLVAADMVTKERFKEALWLHTGEALWRMSNAGPAETSWMPHRSARYSAEFTFSPDEALCGAGRSAAGVSAPDTVVDPSDSFPGHLKTCVFAEASESGGVPLPIAVSGSAELAPRALVELGVAAQRVVHGPMAVTTGASTHAFLGPGGCSVVAYAEGDRTVVVLCADASATARVFARRVSRT